MKASIIASILLASYAAAEIKILIESRIYLDKDCEGPLNYITLQYEKAEDMMKDPTAYNDQCEDSRRSRLVNSISDLNLDKDYSAISRQESPHHFILYENGKCNEIAGMSFKSECASDGESVEGDIFFSLNCDGYGVRLNEEFTASMGFSGIRCVKKGTTKDLVQ